MSLSLNCLVLGDDPEKAFNIEIHKNKSVSHLKDLIKEKRSSRLKDVDASDLDLWQVSFHFDDLDSELANIDLSAHQKLSPPIKRLTTFFTDVEDDCLHVIVRAPAVETAVAPDSTQPLSLNCYVFGDDPKRTFTVRILKNENVGTLQNLIKEGKAARLKDIDASDLDLWRVSYPIVDFGTELEKFDFPADRILHPVKKLGPIFEDIADEHVHVIIKAPQAQTAVDQTGVDEVPDLKEFKRYNKTVLSPGKPPSEGAKSNGYRINQADEALAIYDGRRAVNALVSTIGPPIQIFHPIFDYFLQTVINPDIQPTIEDLENVQDLMDHGSQVGLKEEGTRGYNQQVRKRLRKILKADLHEEPNPDGTRPDGVVTLQRDDARIAYLILELKRELGDGGCDPTTQAGLSMKRSWIDSDRQPVRERCCCPTFLVAGGGPWISVLGGILTDKVIVQRLTDMRWMAVSSTEEDSRVYHNARILIALREALAKLESFYTDLPDTPPFVPNEPHPRYFPYPTSFTADGIRTEFRYLKSLEEDPACVTYLAETVEVREPVKLVVKFVAKYGREAHELLAREGRAPTLLYYGSLRETQCFDVPPGPAQNAPPGLSLRPDLMHMVVMEYIDARRNAPSDANQQIWETLTLLHTSGYVFGDLRKQNILFNANGKVKFIDFNWCGRYDMNICDNGLPPGLQDQIDMQKDSVQVGDECYAHYPLSMSTLEGMWATGMKALAPIRPQHDWMMLDKYIW